MSTTLLPFLYQTRTLQRLARTGVSTPAFRALLHSTAKTNSPRDRPRPLKTRHQDNAEIPFELPEGYEPEPKSDEELDAESGVRSTITPSERDVFNRIFEEIASRNKAGPPPAAPTSTPPPEPSLDVEQPENQPAKTPSGFPDFDATGEFSVRTEEPNAESIRSTINIIVQDAAEVQTDARRQIRKPFDPLHPLSQTTEASEWEKALLRFPPSLRRAAQMALGTMQEDKAAQNLGSSRAVPVENLINEPRAAQQIDLVLDPLSKSVRNEALRREERNRVEAKMRAAKTDFELWDILEEEVFPMVRKLGIDEESNKAAAAATGKRNRKRDKSKLPLHIYGPLYPSYLLNALRLFDTQYARSSPMALHILPRVKELGPASYVLGVSTPFYNELARILWNRYGDPNAVFQLLEEMRVAGLYCDENTLKIVQAMEQFLGSVIQGKWGPFLRELVSLPEYEFAVLPRVGHWMKTINMHIHERRNELQE